MIMGKIDLHPNENIIKAALINNYAHINSKPFVVCSELTISEESKIVDLVFCKDNLSYAYEIKAWNDDMRRLPAQLDAYCKLFDYIYVATTANHLDQLQLIPDFVGIVLYSTKTKKIVYKRRAKKNHLIDKKELLMSIPISYIRNNSPYSKYTRSDNDLFSFFQAHNLFIKHTSSKCRWTNNDLETILHYEDILMNTNYISLDYR
jgi:hypothetical protein